MSNIWIFRFRRQRAKKMQRSSSSSCDTSEVHVNSHGQHLIPPVDSLDNFDQHIPRVRVEFYVNENTFKERLQLYFVKNQRSSLRIRLLNLFLKLLTCVLYILRVILGDDPKYAKCFDCLLNNETLANVINANNLTEEQFSESPYIHWDAIIWVDRHIVLWAIQVTIAIITLSQALLLVYLGYKGNIWQQVLTFQFILEIVNTVPFIITLFWPPLKNLFIPVFLNCWLAKYALENMFNDLHRAMQRSQSALSQQLLILSATLMCLVFTSVSGFQHFQRAGHRRPNLFESLYFVIVTFSTVGFGDVVPDIWPTQLFMVIMICVALLVLPTQVEQLAYTWLERQKLGGTYSSHRAHNEKHVVVCSTTLQADTIMDFLNEFYAHPLLQDCYVVLLSPCELDSTMRMILQVPMWAQRVIYIQGSCLRDTDLTRARMNEAEACFILAARNYADKTAADEHTILRSWAVKDFAPNVPQYLQIFRPENKVHVKFAEYVVCEDEFKYALLANNCMCPGTSTLVTLLLHTSRGQEGQTSDEEWHRQYGRCSGNEIYHIRLGDSRFFGEYEGKSFTYASFHSHRKYGVALVGVRPTDVPGSNILLNPGPYHIMKKPDICFYLNITKEENSAFILANPDTEAGNRGKRTDSLKQCSNIPIGACDADDDDGDSKRAVIIQEISLDRVHFGFGNHLQVPRSEACPGANSLSGSRRASIAPVPVTLGFATGTADDDTPPAVITVPQTDDTTDDQPWTAPWERSAIYKGFPPVSPYIGTSPTLCYLLKEKKPLCCLELTHVCEHCSFKNAAEYQWPNRGIILAADFASNGIYNFIVPLRAHFHPKTCLNPIVLLLEKRPETAFLDAISWFPLIFWMPGSIECLDDLLRAGINLADNVVVVNKESTNSAEEDYLGDCNTIVAVQTMFKLFPSIKVITELSQSSNMRFMQFRARDAYALHLSKMEKVHAAGQPMETAVVWREKERGSHISYMFRLPFAAGSVFSASMLDTLLYQAFVKDYLVTFVRLLLGIDQAPGSGFLTSVKIGKPDMWIRTYGRLYQKLCSTTCEIPIAIYRTQYTHNLDATAYGITLGMEDDRDEDSHAQSIERQEICNLVRCRMTYLGLPTVNYDGVSEKRNSLSYVIINPNCDLKLEEGDIIFLVRPSPFNSQKSFERHPSFRRRSIVRTKAARKQKSSPNPAASNTSASGSQSTSPEEENPNVRITVNDVFAHDGHNNGQNVATPAIFINHNANGALDDCDDNEATKLV